MSVTRCDRCESMDTESYVVKEVAGETVGPYRIYKCNNCDYEWYKEENDE